MSEINKEFVKFKEAKTLRELGFNEKSYAYFDRNNNIQFLYNGFPEKFSDKRMGVADSQTCGYTSAPLYQQVFKWFQKEHKLHSFVDIYPTKEQPERCWYMIRFMDREKSEEDYMSGWFEDQDKAEASCVKKLIQIVKESK